MATIKILIFILFATFRDRKAKKFVSAEKGSVKKIRTEDGTLLPASYRSGHYDTWVEKQKMSYADDNIDGVDNLAPKGSRKWKAKQKGMEMCVNLN
jgi:ATP-dependent RNA helicase DDX54/DBP10